MQNKNFEYLSSALIILTPNDSSGYVYGYLSPLNLTTNYANLNPTGIGNAINLTNNASDSSSTENWKYDSTNKTWCRIDKDGFYCLYYNGSGNSVTLEYTLDESKNKANFRWNNVPALTSPSCS